MPGKKRQHAEGEEATGAAAAAATTAAADTAATTRAATKPKKAQRGGGRGGRKEEKKQPPAAAAAGGGDDTDVFDNDEATKEIIADLRDIREDVRMLEVTASNEELKQELDYLKEENTRLHEAAEQQAHELVESIRHVIREENEETCRAVLEGVRAVLSAGVAGGGAGGGGGGRGAAAGGGHHGGGGGGHHILDHTTAGAAAGAAAAGGGDDVDADAGEKMTLPPEGPILNAEQRKKFILQQQREAAHGYRDDSDNESVDYSSGDEHKRGPDPFRQACVIWPIQYGPRVPTPEGGL